MLQRFQLGVPGVLLEDSMIEAEQHAQRLCGTKHTIGLLTVQPLALQAHLQPVTFKLTDQQATGTR